MERMNNKHFFATCLVSQYIQYSMYSTLQGRAVVHARSESSSDLTTTFDNQHYFVNLSISIFGILKGTIRIFTTCGAVSVAISKNKSTRLNFIHTNKKTGNQH